LIRDSKMNFALNDAVFLPVYGAVSSVLKKQCFGPVTTKCNLPKTRFDLCNYSNAGLCWGNPTTLPSRSSCEN